MFRPILSRSFCYFNKYKNLPLISRLTLYTDNTANSQIKEIRGQTQKLQKRMEAIKICK